MNSKKVYQHSFFSSKGSSAGQKCKILLAFLLKLPLAIKGVQLFFAVPANSIKI